MRGILPSQMNAGYVIAWLNLIKLLLAIYIKATLLDAFLGF